MANPAFVGSTNAIEAGTVLLGAITVTRTTTAGNLLVLYVANDAGGTNSVSGPQVSTVTDSNSVSWTLANPSDGGAAGASTELDCYYLANAAAITSVTVTFLANTSAAATLVEISGGDTLDWTAANSGVGTAWSTGTTSVTTHANEIVLGAYALRGNSTITFAAGPTALTQANTTNTAQLLGLRVAYLIVSSIGTQAMTGTTATSKNWPAQITTWLSSGPPNPAAPPQRLRALQAVRRAGSY